MIKSYTDHAANERTYLAWVRTALAFMGFGLLIERFDLFARALPDAESAMQLQGQVSSNVAGVFMILLGVLVLGVSSARYVRFKRDIASVETRDFRASRGDLVLLVIVGAIGIVMCVYVARQLLGGSP
jgi:putative membrane protein